MAGSLDAFLKANPIKLKVDLDTSGIQSELKALDDKYKVKVGIDLSSSIKEINKSLTQMQQQVSKAKSLKVNIELKAKVSDLANQIKAIQNQMNSAASIKPVKVDIDFNVSKSAQKLINNLTEIKGSFKQLESQVVSTVGNMASKTNAELAKVGGSGVTSRITDTMNTIRNDMQRAFGDGVIDTKVFRNAEQEIQQVSATITKETGEMVRRLYALNKDTGSFELIQQADVDKIQSTTARMKQSIQGLKETVQSLNNGLGGNSQSFALFNSLGKADIVKQSDVNRLKELINSEKEAISVSTKFAQVLNDTV